MWGAEKVSIHFWNYLKQHDQLADHRTDSSYAQWWDGFKKSKAYTLLHLPLLQGS
jgi:hypothetical protein